MEKFEKFLLSGEKDDIDDKQEELNVVPAFQAAALTEVKDILAPITSTE